jgi:replicative DNA helicase
MSNPIGAKTVKVLVNVEQEQRLLSMAMKDPSVLREISRTVRPNHFLSARHRTIYQVIVSIEKKGLSYDHETFLQMAGRLEFGGLKYLKDIEAAFQPTKNLKHHIEALKTAAVKSTVRIGSAQRLIDMLEDPKTTTADITEATREIAREISVSTIGAALEGKELYITSLKNYQQRIKHPSFVPTGFKWLDENLSEGLARGKISVFAARPSIGKSTFVTNIAHRISQMGFRVLFFPIEMGVESTVDALVSLKTSIPLDSLIKTPDELTKEDLLKINVAIKEISMDQDLVFWKEKITIETLFEAISSVKPAVVIIDLFERLCPRKEPGEIAVRLEYVQELAKELNCHIICVHQIRRGVEQRTNKRPTLEFLKSSGAFEEVADTIFACYREAYYDSDVKDVIEAGILKQRRGVRTVWTAYDFEGAYARVGSEVRDWADQLGDFE